MDAVYLPFHVDEVEAFMKTAEIIGVLGFSVTVPHKQAVIPALRVKGPELDRIGSCNTVLRTGGGWIGRNTDFEGFLRPLDRLVPGKKFKSALVIGAGGAARAVVYALAERGIPVVIVNRSPGKAEALAAEMGVRWMKTEDLTDVVRRAPGSFDLVVQTTSAGMHPKTEEDPLPGFAFNGSEIVYDIIYAPEKTRFLARAEKAGAVILGGKEMLEAQAERQFELFKKVYSLRAGRKGNSSNF
jgi:3-dehydroquinate dehydratase/shikimate dehydrogenase